MHVRNKKATSSSRLNNMHAELQRADATAKENKELKEENTELKTEITKLKNETNKPV